jgi:hypothetical protein
LVKHKVKWEINKHTYIQIKYFSYHKKCSYKAITKTIYRKNRKSFKKVATKLKKDEFFEGFELVSREIEVENCQLTKNMFLCGWRINRGMGG